MLLLQIKYLQLYFHKLALLNLYTTIVTQAITSTIHDAEEVGYKTDFYENSRGLEFHLSGLPDAKVIVDIVEAIMTGKCDNESTFLI